MAKTFVGIGSDHETLDFVDKIIELLKEHKPDALTLEYRLDIEGKPKPKGFNKFRVEYSACLQDLEGVWHYFDMKLPRNLYVNKLGLQIPMEPSPEVVSLFAYALKEGIPIYTNDWEPEMPGHIFKFQDRKLSSISLRHLTHDREYFQAFLNNPQYTGEMVTERNQFMVDVLNYLFERHATIAHAGGQLHFYSQQQENKSPVSVGNELQVLVKADKKIVYDLVANNKNRVQTLKRLCT